MEVARRLSVSRRSVHNWIARYEHGGLASLADRSQSTLMPECTQTQPAWCDFDDTG